jgi:hypothetical protein
MFCVDVMSIFKCPEIWMSMRPGACNILLGPYVKVQGFGKDLFFYRFCGGGGVLWWNWNHMFLQNTCMVCV